MLGRRERQTARLYLASSDIPLPNLINIPGANNQFL